MENHPLLIKICGITHPDDAECAVRLGADFIGVIFSDLSKRKITLSLAKEIAQIARQTRIELVGLFVDETRDQIISICEETGIRIVQLHGAIARSALPTLPSDYSIIYAISADKEGRVLTAKDLPPSVIQLYDSQNGGSGKSFDWESFSPPKESQWFLAGGLNPNNVAKAIAMLHPNGVDVTTGVEVPFTTRKDPRLIKAFIQAAKQNELLSTKLAP
jgi:phosphoribosylanthranilate isomerase